MEEVLRENVLAVRILSPTLVSKLTSKIGEAEEKAIKSAKQQRRGNDGLQELLGSTPAVVAGEKSPGEDEVMIDLPSSSCVPTADGSTLWKFKVDDIEFPARLTNLPCPVEVMKTYDHATYYKSADVGQILIVYEDMKALEEAENRRDYKFDDFPSYYHSGLTPPLARVVQRRFRAREHKNAPFSPDEVTDVMMNLKEMISILFPGGSKSKNKSKNNPMPMSLNNENITTTYNDETKVMEVIVDEEVPYEPWMTNFGKTPQGIEFDDTDAVYYQHPELWLSAAEVAEIDEELKKKRKATKAKKSQTITPSKEEETALSPKAPPVNDTVAIESNIDVSDKKGSPSKEVDEVMQAALSIQNNSEVDDLMLIEGDDAFDFDGDSLVFN